MFLFQKVDSKTDHSILTVYDKQFNSSTVIVGFLLHKWQTCFHFDVIYSFSKGGIETTS